MLFNRYLCTKKRAKTCKNLQKRASQVPIYHKNVQKRAKSCKNVHLKYFWTQFKNVHLRGPCSLRPCILRPYCIRYQNIILEMRFCPPFGALCTVYIFTRLRLSYQINRFSPQLHPCSIHQSIKLGVHLS